MKTYFKKVALFAIMAILTVALVTGLAACNPDDKTENNNSVYVTYYADGAAAQAALAAGVIDYAVVGEPAATAGASKGFAVVMDIQAEFNAATGSTSGFPMSSTFVRNDLAANKDFVDAYLAALNDNLAYIQENAANMTALLKAAGSASAFPAASIPKCNVGVYTPDSVKSAVADMMKSLNGMQSVPDSVYYDASAATAQGNGSGTIKVYVPDGAPLLAVANLATQADMTVNGYTVEVVVETAQNISVAMVQGTADIAVLPANAGVNLIASKNVGYKFLCSNTQGILYMIANADGANGTVKPADLAGKKIGCIGQGAAPQYAVEKVLTAAGLVIA